MKYKDIKELSILDYEAINEYRRDILSNSKNFKVGSDDYQYIMELELYLCLKFKNKNFERYERIRQNEKFWSDIDNEVLYNLDVKNYLDKIGTFKFLKELYYEIEKNKTNK